ncbi:MAG: response regulator [Acidobacteria bacterium]|nr:response regulator [Acidobacteriota bacterium]
MVESEPDVLIVEDDKELRDALCRSLEAAGFICHSVKDAWQALALIEDDGWRPRLILLDLMMPRMNGWEFLDRRKRSRDLGMIPVVVLSAADRLRTEALTADAVLRKPVQGNELLEVIRDLLAGPRPVPSA